MFRSGLPCTLFRLKFYGFLVHILDTGPRGDTLYGAV
jgi:hypothetical protein